MTKSLNLPHLATYFVWSPESSTGTELAEEMFRSLCSNPDPPAERGLGIPVRFRTSGHISALPAKIPFGSVSHTAAFILMDDHFLAENAWREYADHLAVERGALDLVVPVVLTDSGELPHRLQGLQAIRLDKSGDGSAVGKLQNRVLHALCRLLAPRPDKVSVFLSHAKSDGKDLATDVGDHVRAEAWLEHFFDEADIPDGSTFADVIVESVSDVSLLLAIQTDTYSSREWCRMEVLHAKQNSVPIVVLDATETGEARSFPYLGNTPTVRWTGPGCLPTLVRVLLREALRARYFPLRAAHVCNLYGRSVCETFVRSPELVSGLFHRASECEADANERILLYPDPPLGTEELRLLAALDADHVPLTPTELSAL